MNVTTPQLILLAVGALAMVGVSVYWAYRCLRSTWELYRLAMDSREPRIRMAFWIGAGLGAAVGLPVVGYIVFKAIQHIHNL